MRIERNLSDGFKKVAENGTLDFYIKKYNRDWYVFAMEKGTNISVAMAGFSTKKVAVSAAFAWSEWME